jgi:hypothetical protein
MDNKQSYHSTVKICPEAANIFLAPDIYDFCVLVKISIDLNRIEPKPKLGTLISFYFIATSALCRVEAVKSQLGMLYFHP